MMNMQRAPKLFSLLSVAAALLVAGCSQSLAPPFPDIAPFPSKVLTKDEQSRAIDDLTAAKNAQGRTAGQPVVQNAVARSYTEKP